MGRLESYEHALANAARIHREKINALLGTPLQEGEPQFTNLDGGVEVVVYDKLTTPTQYDIPVVLRGVEMPDTGEPSRVIFGVALSDKRPLRDEKGDVTGVWQGDDIHGATNITLREGDIFVLKSGTPHAFFPNGQKRGAALLVRSYALR